MLSSLGPVMLFSRGEKNAVITQVDPGGSGLNWKTQRLFETLLVTNW